MIRTITQNHGTKVLVVIGVSRAICIELELELAACEQCQHTNNDWAKCPARILSGIMAVIPCGSVHISPEFVDQLVSRSDGALSNSWDTIEPWRFGLQESVPM
jgi:hypothetical protein